MLKNNDKPARLPLRVYCAVPSRNGAIITGVQTLGPDDPGYEEAYFTAAAQYQEIGVPMPYATDPAADDA